MIAVPPLCDHDKGYYYGPNFDTYLSNLDEDAHAQKNAKPLDFSFKRKRMDPWDSFGKPQNQIIYCTKLL